MESALVFFYDFSIFIVGLYILYIGIGKRPEWSSSVEGVHMAGGVDRVSIGARWISNLANPLVLVAGVFVLVIFQGPDASGIDPAPLLGVCLFFGVFLPVAYVGFLLHKGVIEEVFIAHMTDRKGPLWVLVLSCSVGVGMLYGLKAPFGVLVVMMWYTGLAVLAGVMLFWWKISLHAIGAWGTLGVLFFLFGLPALAYLPLALAISWSRIALGVHTTGQVLGGAGLALLSAGFVFGVLL